VTGARRKERVASSWICPSKLSGRAEVELRVGVSRSVGACTIDAITPDAPDHPTALAVVTSLRVRDLDADRRWVVGTKREGPEL